MRDNLYIMLKRLLLVLALTTSLFGFTQISQAKPTKPRKVAVQTYSLNRFTLEQAVEKLKGLGIDGLECYPGQKISDKLGDAKMGPDMTAEQRDYVKKLLKDANLKIVSFGVTGAGNEKDVRKLCEFAKDMGFDTVLTESPVATFEIWEKLGSEYGVRMLVHNHGKGSGNQYFDPDLVAKYTKGLKYVAASPDVGHWYNAGIKPVEGLKTLKGELGSLHFKDVKNGTCVPLGEGDSDVKAMLAELDKQGFDGYFVMEYEAEWNDNIPSIKKCVDFLRKN